jgi:hypothetical protein
MGAAGASGRAGSIGGAGSTGAAGATGSGGSTGAAGASGSAGATGAAGNGNAGRGGATGAAGNGDAGRGGATGAAGSGSAGRGGATGTAGSGSAGRGGSGGTAGTAGSGNAGRGGTGGTNSCAAVTCAVGRMCCDGFCVNLQNDPFNCGVCGKLCEGVTSFCLNGMCQAPTCLAPILCGANSFCCGNTCCSTGQLCCDPQGPAGGVPPTCFTPGRETPTCPQGCAPICESDRHRKKNIAPVDTSEILKKVGALPISTWSYTNEPSDVRHLGPMAQDFRASFGLGSDDRSFHSVDAHGVALAAIQALERMVAAQEKRIQRLERDNRRLERRLRSADRAPGAIP